VSLLEQALAASECVISVMGAHVGEDAEAVFRRKVADCDEAGCTFWVAKSSRARPEHVQALCASGPGYVFFVEPATPGGARPTTESEVASEYSPDRVTWTALPQGLGPVTGHMDQVAAALVFDQLTTGVQGIIDLWAYVDRVDASRPLKFKLGLSTLCAVRSDTASHRDRMKSRYRRVVAVGHLAAPYCVSLR